MFFSDGLEFLKKNNNKFGFQGPPNHWSDMDLVKYMHDAVAVLNWAQTAMTQCTVADVPWNYQKLFTALNAAWLHHEKLSQAKELKDQPRSRHGDIPAVLWSRQSMNKRSHAPGSSSSAPYRSQNVEYKQHSRQRDHSIFGRAVMITMVQWTISWETEQDQFFSMLVWTAYYERIKPMHLA